MLKNDDHDGVYDWTALFFQKNALYLSFNVFSMKVLIGDTIFVSY